MNEELVRKQGQLMGEIYDIEEQIKDVRIIAGPDADWEGVVLIDDDLSVTPLFNSSFPSGRTMYSKWFYEEIIKI